jgi:hypothetical protein
MEPVGEFTPCFLRVVARFSAHADPNTLTNRYTQQFVATFVSTAAVIRSPFEEEQSTI